ncbi:M1 family metallopeptidase [Niveibacterium sp. COAC-50]|uniref:M1 family metallopeptidase n=1 Tax=Niveibacterium sp. COAC-50 TaxID=2729384 RepID=UPI00155304EE|nr:M1 family metallopeptidase [Niveibacterium sp. COAC-50]
MFLRRLGGSLLGLSLTLCAGAAYAFKLDQVPGALSRSVVPVDYRVELDADPYADSFSGRQTIRFDLRRATREIVLHADALTVRADALDGVAQAMPVEADAQAQTITIRLPRRLEPGRHTLGLSWQGRIEENGEGLYVARYRTPDGVEKRMLATDMEPIGTRRMMPLFDEPVFRARFDISVRTPARFTVLGNMPQASERSLPDGRKEVRFMPTPKMASYLVALAVGEFEAARATHDGIELAIWTTEGLSQQTGYAMAATWQVLDYYHQWFGIRYPLPKLDQLAVPGKRGAMENWGLITYGESLLVMDPDRAGFRQREGSFTTIAHEIAHQWFGNLVTMAWWDDLWLNEAFAEWMGVKAARELNPAWRALDNLGHERDKAMLDDALPTAKPIARAVASDRAAFDSFDATTYNKGHMVIGLIEQYLGEQGLRDGIRSYLGKHAYSNATGADLWDALAKRSGKPVAAFAQAWTTRPGHPTVFASRTCEQGQEQISLRQQRYGFGAIAGADEQWPLPLQLAAQDGATRERIELGSAPQVVTGPACRTMRSVEPSPFDLWRLAWDDNSLHALLARFPQLSSEQRARLLGDAWALAQTGDVRIDTVVAMLDALPVSDTPQTWSSAIAVMRAVRGLTRNTPHAAAWDARVRGWLAPVGERLAALPTDQQEQPAFAILIADVETLRGLAGDVGVIALARQQFARAEPNVSRDRYVGLLQVFAAQATPAEFDALLARSRENRDTGLEWAYGNALAYAPTPEAVEKVLALSLEDALPRAVRDSLAGWLAEHGHARRVWTFTQAHIDTLFARASTWARRYIVSSPLDGARDAALAAEIDAYAAAHLTDDERPTVKQALAGSARNIEAWQRIGEPLARVLGLPDSAATASTGASAPPKGDPS